MQTFKKKTTGDSIDTCIVCNTELPHTPLPAEMLMGRFPRTPLDLALPDSIAKVEQSQKDKHDCQAVYRMLQVGDNVQIHKFPAGNSWLPEITVKVSSPLSFNIKLPDGRIVHCHIDHILLHSQQTSTVSPDWLCLPDKPHEQLPLPRILQLLLLHSVEFLYLLNIMDMGIVKPKREGM